MRGRRQLAVVRDLAALPQPQHVAAIARDLAHAVVARGDLERDLVGGHRRAGEAVLARKQVERRGQRLDRAEVEARVAPLQEPDLVETVRLQHLDEFAVERRAAAGRAERAVADVAPGAPGDLPELGRVQPPVVPAVELAVAGEGDVVDVEVETHADRVGGNDVVDVARLIHLDLRVAGARRQRAQHDRGAATLATDQLGDGVDLLGREGDDGRARRQARQLLLAGEGERRHPLAGDDLDAGQQAGERALHRLRADEQRFLEPAPIEDAIGERMAAVEVGCELDLVDGDEGEVEVARHRLDRADPVAGLARLDLLLAGDQRDGVRADLLDDAIVDLAREQAQRQADHAGAVRQHALDREMRLAGVGRAQHERDPRSAIARRGGAGGGEGEVHRKGDEPSREGTKRGADQGSCGADRESLSHDRGAPPQPPGGSAAQAYHNGTRCKGHIHGSNDSRTNRARIGYRNGIRVCSHKIERRRLSRHYRLFAHVMRRHSSADCDGRTADSEAPSCQTEK